MSAARSRQILELIRRAGPMELPLLLEAIDKCTDGPSGDELLSALLQAPGRPSLSTDAVRRAFRNHPQTIQSAANSAFVLASSPAEDRLRNVEGELPAGEPAKGRSVFFGQKAGCFACHRVGSEGGSVGPDLSRIGDVRSRRDLLEAVLYPSASFARGYEPVTIATDAGEIYSGLVAMQDAGAITIVDAQRRSVRIARSAIDELAPGKVSIMPAGLDQTLSYDELSDVLAFLQSLK